MSVLCTAPRKYHVIESEGLVKAHCRIDVVLRHKEPVVEDASVDKFQIQLFEHGSSTVRGHKQVISQVLPSRPKVRRVLYLLCIIFSLYFMIAVLVCFGRIFHIIVFCVQCTHNSLSSL